MIKLQAPTNMLTTSADINTLSTSSTAHSQMKLHMGLYRYDEQ